MASRSYRETHGGRCECGIFLSEPFSNVSGRTEQHSRHNRRLSTDDVRQLRNAISAAKTRNPQYVAPFSDAELDEMEKTGLCPRDRGGKD